jgi:CHAT domain
MKTLVLRIGAPAGNGKRPLELFFEDSPDWWKLPIASEELAGDLGVAPPEQLNDGSVVDRAFALGAFTESGGQPDRLDGIGRYLFRLVSTGSVGNAWSALRAHYPGERPQATPATEGIRLVLTLVEELKELPWELMVDLPRPPVFRDILNPAVIGAFEPGTAVAGENWPLRVLIVIACARDDQDVRWREELDQIKALLIRQRQLVDFEVLERPEADPLRERIRIFQPHVLHFIGHGTLDPSTGRPALAFYRDATRDNRFWDAAGIRSDLNGLPSIPFVFVNACRSSAPPSASHRWQLADAFLRTNTRAVLGMRADIRGDVAARFAEGAYRALARRQPLDVAIAEARANARNLPGLGPDSADWAMPCLETTVHPEDVLPMRLGVSTAVVERIEQEGHYCDVGVLVDRHELRRELLLGIDPIFGGKPKPLTIVTGDTELGKSWLIKWCLYRPLLRGRTVLFVDLNRENRLNYVDVLDRIARGETMTSSGIGGPIAPKVMHRFLHDADRLLRKLPPAAWDEVTIVDPLKLPSKGVREKLAEEIFKRFEQALAEITRSEPLILALDHVDRGVQPDHFTKYVLQYLVRPVAAGRAGNVQLLLAVRDRKEFGLDAIPGASFLELRPFPRADYVAHATEYMQLRGFPPAKGPAVQNLIQSLLEFQSDPWPPTELAHLNRVVKQ